MLLIYIVQYHSALYCRKRLVISNIRAVAHELHPYMNRFTAELSRPTVQYHKCAKAESLWRLVNCFHLYLAANNSVRQFLHTVEREL